MEYRGNKLRHELKYVISNHEYLILRNRLKHCIETDKNHVNDEGYHIRSLYFDDLNDSMYKEKEMGVLKRKKYRIRIYNKNDAIINIERKSKFGQYISKEGYRISKEEYYNILNGQYSFLLNKKEPFFIDLYIELSTKLMKPKVIVDYLREAYVSKAGNVRITFDKELCGSNNNFDVFDNKVITKNVFNRDVMIMEVKYDSFIPEYIKNLLQISNQDFIAVSKYVMCRKIVDEYK